MKIIDVWLFQKLFKQCPSTLLYDSLTNGHYNLFSVWWPWSWGIHWNQVVHLFVCLTFAWKIASEALNCMQPNLACWCIIKSIMKKGWVPIFKSRSQCRFKSSKITFFHISWTFATILGIVVHYNKQEYCKNIAVLEVKVTVRVEILREYYPKQSHNSGYIAAPGDKTCLYRL